jgi:hypothetical protein
MVESGMSPSSHLETCILEIADGGCPSLLCESGKKMRFIFINSLTPELNAWGDLQQIRI